MLPVAVLVVPAGYIAQECFRWPGYLSKVNDIKFADVPNGIKGLAAVPPLGLAQIVLFIGLMEIVTWRYYEGPWPGTVPEGKAPAGSRSFVEATRNSSQWRMLKRRRRRRRRKR